MLDLDEDTAPKAVPPMAPDETTDESDQRESGAPAGAETGSATQDTSVANGATVPTAGAADAVAIINALQTSVAADATVLREGAENESAPVPDTPDKSKRRAAAKSRWVKELLAAGCDPAKVDALVAARQVNTDLNGDVAGKKAQRTSPVWATATAPETRLFWKSRSDQQIEADVCKLHRQDGGTIGPLQKYEAIIRNNAGNPARAAEQLVVEVRRRISSILIYVQMALNELRVRRAEREGRDPKGEKYLVIDSADLDAAGALLKEAR